MTDGEPPQEDKGMGVREWMSCASATSFIHGYVLDYGGTYPSQAC